jgi:hypothetical protein
MTTERVPPALILKAAFAAAFVLILSSEVTRKIIKSHQSVRRELAIIDPKTEIVKQVEANANFPDQSALLKLGQKPLFDQRIINWKNQLFQRLDRIRENCGELCTVNHQESLDKYTVQGAGQTFRQLRIPVQCKPIMIDEGIDATDPLIPYPPPQELIPFFTMNGLIKFELYRKLENVYVGGQQAPESFSWTADTIKEYQQNFDKSDAVPYLGYGEDTRVLMSKLRKYTNIKGKNVLVLGADRVQGVARPWLESMCLHLGAAHVTTLDYVAIQNSHPQITTITPTEFRHAYANRKMGPFDVIVSFSTVEHYGLGRYGDALNPWGDILAVARARCVTKPGGILVLAVPTHVSYQDFVEFNDRRVYGKIRLPILTANWKQLDGDDHLQQEPNFQHQKAFVFVNAE